MQRENYLSIVVVAVPRCVCVSVCVCVCPVCVRLTEIQLLKLCVNSALPSQRKMQRRYVKEAALK